MGDDQQFFRFSSGFLVPFHFWYLKTVRVRGLHVFWSQTEIEDDNQTQIRLKMGNVVAGRTPQRRLLLVAISTPSGQACVILITCRVISSDSIIAPLTLYAALTLPLCVLITGRAAADDHSGSAALQTCPSSRSWGCCCGRTSPTDGGRRWVWFRFSRTSAWSPLLFASSGAFADDRISMDQWRSGQRMLVEWSSVNPARLAAGLTLWEAVVLQRNPGFCSETRF